MDSPVDLDARTLTALDWPVLLDALAGHARTLRGAAAARRGELAQDARDARARLAAVQEVWSLEEVGEIVPVGAVHDVGALVEATSRGKVLEGHQLQDLGKTLVALDQLRGWLDLKEEVAPRLAELAAPLVVDPELRELLAEAFDEVGQLSEKRFPELGELRRRIVQLRGRIRRTLEDLVHGDGLGGQLQDRFYTERNGRWVVPVKQTYRRGLGIVHGRSQSGETVFVEPAQVVEATNELKEAEFGLEREERRILAGLSAMVGAQADGISVCLEAAEEIDLACARAGLGEALDGRIPRVLDEGVVLLKTARHPVLQLRGLDVVANDLRLDSRVSCLVLTGPNAGGKTVALKTVGLAALMVRAGIPIPADDTSRVDFFGTVLADIGDLQTVQGDLSTFSAHLTVLREVLARAGAGSLVLLDEIGMGTDPAQGAALAQAVVEAVIEAQARVVVTTHYAALKGLGARDPRVALGAVEVRGGQPTYKVVHGLAGESHAFAVARRLGLADDVIDRAREVMDAGTRELTELMEQLSEERGTVEEMRDGLAEERRLLAAERRRLETRISEVDARRKKLQDEVAQGYQARLRGQERQLKKLIAALQTDPNLRDAGAVLGQVRGARQELGVKLAPEPEPGPAPVAVVVGDPVRVKALGAKGKVVRLLASGKVEVMVGRMKMKVGLHELATPRGQDLAAPPKPKAKPVSLPPKAPKARPKHLGGVRTGANTCDLRGERVEAALDKVDAFLDKLVFQGQDVGFILHGHGTGALKTAVRRHLPSSRVARRWRPANPEEGGDAYTIVEVEG